MQDKIVTAHSGEEIEFIAHSEKWKCEKWSYENQSLQKVKDYIDKKQKQEHGEFVRRKVIFSKSYDGLYLEAEATSVNENGDVWLSYVYDKEKRRSLEPASKVFKTRDDFAVFKEQESAMESAIKSARQRLDMLRKNYTSKLTHEKFEP